MREVTPHVYEQTMSEGSSGAAETEVGQILRQGHSGSETSKHAVKEDGTRGA